MILETSAILPKPEVIKLLNNSDSKKIEVHEVLTTQDKNSLFKTITRLSRKDRITVMIVT